MIVVVDTNIVFSTILNPKSLIGELLMNVQEKVSFFAPYFLKEEIEKYSEKIVKYSKLNVLNVNTIKQCIWNVLNFVENNNISTKNWQKAFEILKNIDPKDTPFLALGLELNSKIWTGDKKLLQSIPENESKK